VLTYTNAPRIIGDCSPEALREYQEGEYNFIVKIDNGELQSNVHVSQPFRELVSIIDDDWRSQMNIGISDRSKHAISINAGAADWGKTTFSGLMVHAFQRALGVEPTAPIFPRRAGAVHRDNNAFASSTNLTRSRYCVAMNRPGTEVFSGLNNIIEKRAKELEGRQSSAPDTLFNNIIALTRLNRLFVTKTNLFRIGELEIAEMEGSSVHRQPRYKYNSSNPPVFFLDIVTLE
jgi:hypothetical protein